jgi:hypothetical protein
MTARGYPLIIFVWRGQRGASICTDARRYSRHLSTNIRLPVCPIITFCGIELLQWPRLLNTTLISIGQYPVISLPTLTEIELTNSPTNRLTEIHGTTADRYIFSSRMFITLVTKALSSKANSTQFTSSQPVFSRAR